MSTDARTFSIRPRLLLGVGLAAFAIAGLLGYWWGANGPTTNAPTVVAEYGGEVVTEPSDDAWRAQAEAVVHDEAVRALDGLDADDVAALGVEEVPGAGSGSDGSSFVAIDAGGGSEAEGGDGSPSPIPRDVIDDGFLWRFVDMAEVPFAPVPDDFRFDLCAGPAPFSDPLPGCPGGSGATIVPLDSHVYYSIDWFNDPACVTDDEVVRLALSATRPSRVEVSAWNYVGADRLGVQPDRTPDQFVVVESTPTEIDDWMASPTPIWFCVEITGLERGAIHLAFEGTSVLALETDLTDGGSREIRWYARNLSRPPTTAVPVTVDTVYVSAYRRSADQQQTFVQARVFGEQSCDNEGDISLVGSNPRGVQSVPGPTVELRTHLAGWPWDPSWDLADVHSLRLETGTLYLICVYWVESGGPSFQPDSVVRTEVMLAVPPDLSTMTVSVDNIQFIGLEDDDPRINSVSVIPSDLGVYGCRGISVNTNSGASDAYFLGPDPLCTVTSPGLEFDRGGFTVETRALDSLGNTYSRTVFVRVRPADIRCEAPCDLVVRHVSIPLPYVPKREITGSAEWPGTFETGAIPPDGAGEEGLPAGAVGLILRFDPTGYNWWGIDTFREVEQSPSRAPLRPRFDLNVTTTASRETLSAEASFELIADRDVSMQATVTGPGGTPPCVAMDEGRAYSSASLSETHSFTFGGLCAGTQYEVHVTALDEAGAPGQVTSHPSVADEQIVPFGTAGIDVVVSMEFEVLGAQPSDGDNVFHVRHLPQFEIYSLIPGYRSATPRVVPTSGSGGVVVNPAIEAAATGWTFNLPYNNVMCVAESDGALGASFARRAVPSQRNWSVRTDANGVRVHFQVEFGMAPRLYVGEGSTVSSTLCTSGFSPAGTYTIDETLTFDQLAAGVEFISDDGLFAIRVSG